MRYTKEFNLIKFEAWLGGLETKNTIIEHGEAEEFNSIIEEFYDHTPTETEVNDLLWFDADYIFDQLGIEIE